MMELRFSGVAARLHRIRTITVRWQHSGQMTHQLSHPHGRTLAAIAFDRETHERIIRFALTVRLCLRNLFYENAR
jgi:hypothetical protein